MCSPPTFETSNNNNAVNCEIEDFAERDPNFDEMEMNAALALIMLRNGSPAIEINEIVEVVPNNEIPIQIPAFLHFSNQSPPTSSHNAQ